MSRYEINVYIGETDCAIVYGHDHVTGYFVDVFSYNREDLIVGYSDKFGWHYHKSANVMQKEYAERLVSAVISGAIPTEKMVRDPKEHLGAAMAQWFDKGGQ